MTDSNAAPGSGDPLVGELLAGRYRILSKLGEGAMGAVYLGEHIRIGRRDAIKVLRRDINQDAESMSRFVRGARNVSLIRHPNVCAIYDFSDTAEGTQFLAMELIEGESLKDVLDREGRLPLDRALRIAEQVADALQAAHEAGVIHRDLKPGNVMITHRADGSEVVKVVDFDIAKGPEEAQGEEVTRLGFVVGTPEYMSPEQLMGERLDGRSDLYSLGVMLFRMLTGLLPFRASGTQEMMIERLTTPPLRLDEVLPSAQLPGDLGDVLARSLSRKREDRQPGTAAFAQELRAAAAGVVLPRPATVAGAAPPAAPGAAPATRIAAAPTVPPTVPPTVVAPAAALPQGAAGAAAGTVRPRRGVLATAAVVVLALTGIGAVALVASRRGEADRVVTQEPVPGGSQRSQEDTPTGGGSSPAGAEQLPGPQAPRTPDVQQGGTPGGGGPRPQPEQPATRPALPGSVAEVLDRQLMALADAPSRAALLAITDTATIAWNLSSTRSDSGAAALALAQAALFLDRSEECRRWARRALDLGVSAAQSTLEVCG